MFDIFFHELNKISQFETVKLGIYRLEATRHRVTLWATENPDGYSWKFDSARGLWLVGKVGSGALDYCLRQDEVRSAITAIAVLALSPPRLVLGGDISSFLRRLGYAHGILTKRDAEKIREMGWTDDQIAAEMRSGALCPDMFGPKMV